MSDFCEDYEIIEEEDGRFTAVDPATSVASFGDSVGEAVENLREALEGYYSSQGADVSDLDTPDVPWNL